jgi:DNA polymerase
LAEQPATVDIESFSRVNLKKAGLYRYAEDPSTDLLCVCWAHHNESVEAWVPSADKAFAEELQAGCAGLFPMVNTGPTPPASLLRALKNFTAWNAAFERSVLNGPAGQRYGIPHIEIEHTRCSMARSRHASMPGKLEDAARVLNTPVQKRVSGLNAMRYLCKPRSDGTRPTIVEERARFLALVPYCADDVRAEQCVDAVLPEMSPKELRVYQLDQRINDRGVRVDLGAVADFEALIAEYKTYLKERCRDIAGCSPTQTAVLAKYIRENGYPELENLQADTVRKVVLDPAAPDSVKEVLRLYSTHNMKAVAKYPAMREAVCRDGRIRGMLQYHAAGTGRWSSFIVQIHNLFRPVIGDPEVAVDAAKARDLDWIRAMYPGVDPMKVFASCVRSCLVADEGKELVFPDFSGIESRWCAWMFGEQWKLDAFATGRDTYVEAYARSFNVPSTSVGYWERLIGKVLELSMQYQGGVGAFIKMAANYKLDLSRIVGAFEHLPEGIRMAASDGYDFAPEKGRGYGLDKEVWLAAEGLKLAWRAAHPKIVWGWKNLNDAAQNAVANPGQIYAVCGKRLQFKVEGRWLIMRLPSGRKTRYFEPRLEGDRLVYEGVDTVTRMWGKTSTYGGKLCENQAQAGCRDLLADAMLNFDSASVPIVMHVHDEPVFEAPIGTLPDDYVDGMMTLAPGWAHGFPLAIEGHRGKRYRK